MIDGLDQGNQIFGGITILDITDDKGQLLYEEPSRAYYTVSPYFLVNGKEDEERVRRIAEFVDREIGICRYVDMKFEDFELHSTCKFHPALDGKLCREYLSQIVSVANLKIKW